jgi:hypothetical protein
MTADGEIRDRIKALVAEEHDLRARRAAGSLSEEDERGRLAAIEVEVDRCWDLLRQREALRDAGEDPDQATARSGDQVEGYLS